MNNRLKAFTILEMLINIAIMSIIIGMVYFIYSSFSQQVLFYQENIEEENVVGSFCLRIKEDFFVSERIYGTENSLEFISYDTKRIFYEIENGYIFRSQNGEVDSLKIDKLDVSFIENEVLKKRLVQKLKITTYLFKEKLDVTFGKKYPDIIELSTDYGN